LPIVDALEAARQNFPRLLVIDPTRVGYMSATGQFKSMLLGEWDQSRVMQVVATSGPAGISVVSGLDSNERPMGSFDELMENIKAFAPEAIYCRPDSYAMHHLRCAVAILDEIDAPAVLHIMDDWHGIAGMNGGSEFEQVDDLTRDMVARCKIHLTDGDAYASDFSERFGVPFRSLLNGVVGELWEAASPRYLSAGFTLVHMGNLEPTMSRQSLSDISDAVQELASEFPISLHIYVRDYLLEEARQIFRKNTATFVLPQDSDATFYVSTLKGSSLNLYAYNFDDQSQKYIGKGIPNKTCELVAARRPILAYGPETLACIRYMRDNKLAHVISVRSVEALKSKIRAVRDQTSDPYSAGAQGFIDIHHNRDLIRKAFVADIQALIAGTSSDTASLRGDATTAQSPSNFGLAPKKDVNVSKSSLSSKHQSSHPRQDWAAGTGSGRAGKMRSAGFAAARFAVGHLLRSVRDWHFFSVASLVACVVGLACATKLGLTQPVTRLLWGGLCLSVLAIAVDIVVGLVVRHSAWLAVPRPIVSTVGRPLQALARYWSKFRPFIHVGVAAFLVSTVLSALISPVLLVAIAALWSVVATILALGAAAFIMRRLVADMINIRTHSIFVALANQQEQHRLAETNFAAYAENRLESYVDRAKGEMEAAKAELEVARSEATGLVRRLRSLTTPKSEYLPFTRKLGDADRDRMITYWSGAFGMALKDAQLAYFVHRINAVEDGCIGRLATDIEAAVIRTMTVWAVRAKSASVLEIGTLFGIATASIYDVCHPKFTNLHMTMIDPLDGYYETGAADILIDIPITRATVEENMLRSFIPASNYTIIQGLSEDQAVRQIAAQRRYDVVLIDGDHSFEGVKRDFENYIDLVNGDGFIIFDDYGVEEWDGVQKYVDEAVRPRKDIRIIGVGSRTIVFQKLADGGN